MNILTLLDYAKDMLQFDDSHSRYVGTEHLRNALNLLDRGFDPKKDDVSEVVKSLKDSNDIIRENK